MDDDAITITTGAGVTDPEDERASSPEEELPMVGGESPLPDARIPEDITAAASGSLADRMRAQATRLAKKKTRRFPIPDTDIVVEAKVIKDARAVRKGIKSEVFIVRATNRLLLLDENGGEEEIPSWGTDLAALLGVKVEKASELVQFLFDRNPWAIDRFVADLLLWMQGRVEEIEEDLGE